MIFGCPISKETVIPQISIPRVIAFLKIITLLVSL